MVRAVSPGSFHHPAASVEDMYRPAYRARTDAGTRHGARRAMSRRRAALAPAAALALAAGALAFDRWVDATVLPPLAPETSAVVVDRHGALLSAYTVADGRWRLPVALDAVDRGYLDQLVAFEDRRFRAPSRRRPAGAGPRRAAVAARRAASSPAARR